MYFFLIFIPERAAASAFPPMAYKYLPNEVLWLTNAMIPPNTTTIRIGIGTPKYRFNM
jgi:hypothetical protein